MIVTLDTAILVRATTHSHGSARRLLDLLVSQPEHSVVLSRYILSEVGKTLCYSSLYRKLKLDPVFVEAFLAYLTEITELVEPAEGLPVVLSDPKDDPVIYTAIAATANVFCTRDKAFYARNVVAFAERHDLVIMNELKLLALLRQ